MDDSSITKAANTRSIRELFTDGKPGEQAAIQGWVRTKRDSKTFSFIECNDGSCLRNLQIIADESMEGYAETVLPLSTGSSVEIIGTLVESPGKEQAVELHAEQVTVFGAAPADYPLQKKRHSFEYLREIAHLRPRTNTIGAVARLRSSLSYAIHSFFYSRGFQYVHTPIITTSDCEGAGEMFRVSALDFDSLPHDESGAVDFSQDFFGKQANLTVSGQLEAEIYALALRNVYTFGPTFRAENSNTSRHLAEFWMVEPEIAFAGLEEDMTLAEEFVRYLAAHVLENDTDDIAFFNTRIDSTVVEVLEHLRDSSFEHISYTDAIKHLEKNNDAFEYKVSWGIDIQSEHEHYLTGHVCKKPVIVYDYPKAIKAFYMKENEDGKTVRAMDVLVPRIGELIGGSEREDDYMRLKARINETGLNEKNYWWYLELRKFGGVRHAGFGLGFERLLLLVTGLKNIREVIPFPRYPGSAEF
jgi:asparaginyl-tRNA synthetase